MKGRNTGTPGYRSYLMPGNYKIYDDMSGVPFGSSLKKKTWDGFICFEKTYYERNPQDFPTISRGIHSIPEARPKNSYQVPFPENYVLVDSSDNQMSYDNGLVEVTNEGETT